jgi:hypothetical protein
MQSGVPSTSCCMQQVIAAGCIQDQWPLQDLHTLTRSSLHSSAVQWHHMPLHPPTVAGDMWQRWLNSPATAQHSNMLVPQQHNTIACWCSLCLEVRTMDE